MDDPQSLRLYLVRHGVVAKTSGHLPAYDADLAPDQPALLALPGQLPDDALWYVSPLRRTQQTFDIIAPKQAIFEIDPRLEEQNFGLWHEQEVSKVWQEIEAQSTPWHPVSFVNPDLCPPQGTSFDEIFDKTAAILTDLIALRPAKPVIIISHAGTTKALLGHMMGLSAAQSLMLTIETGSVSCADYINTPHNKNLPAQMTSWQIQYVNRLYLKSDL